MEEMTWLPCFHRFHSYCIRVRAQTLSKALEGTRRPACGAPVNEGAWTKSVLDVSERAMPEELTRKRQRAAAKENPVGDTPASSSSQGQRMGVIEDEGNSTHPLEQVATAGRAVHARDEDGSDNLFCIDSPQETPMAARLAAYPAQLMCPQ